MLILINILVVTAADFDFDSLFYHRVPVRQVAALKLLAITIVSKNDGGFLCRVHLKGVQTLESLLDQIVQEVSQ